MVHHPVSVLGSPLPVVWPRPHHGPSPGSRSPHHGSWAPGSSSHRAKAPALHVLLGGLGLVHAGAEHLDVPAASDQVSTRSDVTSGKIFSNSLPPLPDPPEPSVTGLNPLEDREPETRGGEEQSDRWSLDKSPIPTHLCPMFSLFLVSAFFPSPTFVNWTYASPEGLPLKSVRCEIRET